MASNAIVRTWESIAAIVRNLNIGVHEINAVLSNKTDSAGGFKWEFALASSADASRGDAQAEDEEDDYEDEVRRDFVFFFLCRSLLQNLPRPNAGAKLS
jgi:hypothetical protein